MAGGFVVRMRRHDATSWESWKTESPAVNNCEYGYVRVRADCYPLLLLLLLLPPLLLLLLLWWWRKNRVNCSRHDVKTQKAGVDVCLVKSLGWCVLEVSGEVVVVYRLGS